MPHRKQVIQSDSEELQQGFFADRATSMSSGIDALCERATLCTVPAKELRGEVIQTASYFRRLKGLGTKLVVGLKDGKGNRLSPKEAEAMQRLKDLDRWYRKDELKAQLAKRGVTVSDDKLEKARKLLNPVTVPSVKLAVECIVKALRPQVRAFGGGVGYKRRP